MRKKETIAVAMLFSVTTILKICSIFVFYTYKVHDTTYQRSTHLTHHNKIENDLLCSDDSINVEPQADLGFKHTIVANR